MSEMTLFEKSAPGRRGCIPPVIDLPEVEIPESMRPAAGLDMPELSELEVMRHFVRLSQLNYGIDTTMYPLGSCTMKYNPRVNELTARLPGFARLHPMQEEEACQGALELMFHLQNHLAEITAQSSGLVQGFAGHTQLCSVALQRLARGASAHRLQESLAHRVSGLFHSPSPPIL